MSIVINHDKLKIRRAFAKASVSYDDFAQLQLVVANSLLHKNALTSLYGNVLDIGCGTGFLTHQLQQMGGFRQLLALDIAIPMLLQARQRLLDSANYVCGDAESLPLQDASLDSVFSSLALQWCQNLPATLQECRRVLKPGGRLVFATFGAETLCELKQAWASVDDYRHVNEFYTVQQIRDLFLNSAWRTVEVDSQLFQPRYASVSSLLHELKAIGAQSVSAGRKRQLTSKAHMQQMFNAYPRGGDADDIVASFEIIWVIAEAGL
ncbi:MAG: malonyl-ACP O-methyltransferase BioC [Methylococcales bacterium]